MAYKYSPNFNAEIRNTVRNFNKKVVRAENRRMKHVPFQLKVSDLKERYSTENELRKELALLQQFSTKDEATMLKWTKRHLKANEEKAIQYYVDRYKLLAARMEDMPGQANQVKLVEQNLTALEKDLNTMDADDFRRYEAAMKGYFQTAGRRRGAYRGYMSQVIEIMRNVGIDEKEINRYIRKVKTLTPDEFTKMWSEDDVVSAIYDIADSPKYTGGELKMYVTEKSAKQLVDLLIERVDETINKAKQPIEWTYDPFAQLEKSIAKHEKYMPVEMTKEGKLKRSTMSPKDVSFFKSRGWGDLIDESQ